MEKIEKIIFCSNLEDKNCAIIYYEQPLKLFNRKEGVRIIASYMKQKGYTSYESSNINQKIFYMEKEQFQASIKQAYFSKDRVINQMKEEIKKELEGKTIKHKKMKKFIFSCYLIGVILNGISIQKSPQSISTIKIEQKQNQDIEEETIYSLLQDKNMNSIKRNIFSRVWEYLREYNFRISEEYKDKKVKLVHSFDEVKAQYLMYNDLSQKDYCSIFLRNDVDTSKLKEEYKKSVDEEVMFSIIQKTSSFKEGLIKNEKAYAFYKKYENILIEFNKEEDKSKKGILASIIYEMIRKDFQGKKKIKSYMLSVEPILRTIEISCSEYTGVNKLTKKQMKKIYQVFDYTVKKKISKYQKYSTSLANSTDEISYMRYKTLAIKQLEQNNHKNNEVKSIKDKRIQKIKSS